MDIVLWVLQIVLGIKLFSVSVTHGPGQSKQTMQDAIRKMGRVARPLLTLAAISTFLGTAGLILPGILGLPKWLTPVTAGNLAGLLLVSILFHIRARENPKIFVSIVLFIFTLLVGYGRWVLVP